MKIGYARVSTIDQNLDLQMAALEAFGCKIIYTEKKSGIKARPELDALLQYIREGDTLVIWKLDRLGRSLKNLLDIIEDLKERNIGVISLSDNLDSTTPTGKLFLQITGAFAEYERNIIVERTRAGLAVAVEKGKKLGRRKGLSEQAIAVATAAGDLYLAGNMNVTEICKSLKISTATFYRYLRHQSINKKNNFGRKKH